MRTLWAEVTLGWRRATRGPLLGAMLAALALCLFLIPGRHDEGLVLTGYGTGLAWAILLVSALWCGGTAYALDRERHRLTLSLTKPLRRWTLWWGRFLGTLAPFAAAIALLGVCLAFRPLPAGRDVVAPILPDLDEAAVQELATLRAQGRAPKGIVSDRRLLRAIRDHLRTRYCELFPDQPRTYRFPAPDRQGAAAFRLSGAPFLGVRNALRLELVATCGPNTLTLTPDRLTDIGFVQPLPDGFLIPGEPVAVTLRRADDTKVASVIYRERMDVALLLPGQPAWANLAAFCLTLLLTVAMATALGTALGCAFSLPVTLFVGTVAILSATAAALSPPTTVADEIANWWTRLSAHISLLVAQPFRGLVALNPLGSLMSGIAIPPAAVARVFLTAALPWALVFSLAAPLSAVTDEEP